MTTSTSTSTRPPRTRANPAHASPSPPPWRRACRVPRTGQAFALVDHPSPTAVDSAMTAFHGVYAGVNLTDDADTLAGQHEPWTVSGGQQPDTWTWGALQQSTRPWTPACRRPGSSSPTRTRTRPASTSPLCAATSTPGTAPAATDHQNSPHSNYPQPVRALGRHEPAARPAASQASSGTAGQSSIRAPMTATRSASPWAGSAGSRPVSALTRASR